MLFAYLLLLIKNSMNEYKKYEILYFIKWNNLLT